MWGTDNERIKSTSDQRVLKSTARILCDMCPIRAQCLAQSIISREQHNRIGGLDVKARRILRRHAEADGVNLSPSSPARTRNLTVWLREHPELVREVRTQSTTREGRRRRSEDQYIYRHRKAMREKGRRSIGHLMCRAGRSRTSYVHRTCRHRAPRRVLQQSKMEARETTEQRPIGKAGGNGTGDTAAGQEHAWAD